MKIITFLICSFFISINCAFGGNFISSKLPVEKLPNPENCASACHNVGNIYDEFSSSAHKDLECFDCHLPSKVQEVKYNNKEDRGFFRLGYHKQDQTWEETPGNEACQRCHVDQGMAGTNQECWTCHMPENGKDKILFPAQGINKDTKILPHRSHTFKAHTNK